MERKKKKDKNELRKQKETDRKQIYGYQRGKKGSGGINQEFGIS